MTVNVLDSRYQLHKQLGSGGQGRVFRGLDLHTGAPVAIKILDEDRSPEAVARFEQEGRLAARIRDPHLIAALHFGVSEGRRYIVYEYLAGVAPVTTLLALGRLDPFLVCDLALQLLGALDALHEAGVAHLDLAPPNCLWRERSSGRVEVFLADLGSAAAMVPVTGGPHRTSEPVGTVFYMAPEMLEGRPVDHRADLWSLGALMYRLLLGHNVNRGNEDEPLEVPPPAMLVPKIPQAISDVVMTALAPVERRFSSAVEMAEAIDAAMSERPPITVRVPRRTGMSVRAGIGGMALTAGLGSLLGLQLAAEPPRAAECSNHIRVETPILGMEASDAPSTASNDSTPDLTGELVANVMSPKFRATPDTTPDGPAPRPSMRAVLDARDAALRRCSDLAGGLLVVEFTTAEGRDGFSAVAVRGRHDPKVAGCVRQATEDLRFEPQASRTFTEEYMP